MLNRRSLLMAAAGTAAGSGGAFAQDQAQVTTGVGTFEAHHYRFPPRASRPLHPSGTPLSEDIWVTHPDYTFVRAEVHGYLRNPSGFGRYELVEFDA